MKGRGSDLSTFENRTLDTQKSPKSDCFEFAMKTKVSGSYILSDFGLKIPYWDETDDLRKGSGPTHPTPYHGF